MEDAGCKEKEEKEKQKTSGREGWSAPGAREERRGEEGEGRERVRKVYILARDGVGRYVRSAKSAQSARIEWRVWYVTMRGRRRRSKERGAQGEGERKEVVGLAWKEEATEGRWLGEQEELPESHERMRWFRYRPAAGRVSLLLSPAAARPVSVSFFLVRSFTHWPVPGRPVSV